MNVPEYSYALHHRETSDPHAPGRDNPHAHVILPGTFDSWTDGARLPLYMNQNRRENHIELLHETAQRQLDSLLQREVGPDWEERYDRQIAEQERLANTSPEEETIIAGHLSQPPLSRPEPPHTFLQDEDDNVWRVWIATQQSTPDLRRVGLLLAPDPPDTPAAERFAPLAHHLTPGQAKSLTQHLLSTLRQAPAEGLDRAISEAMRVQAMSQAERTTFFEDLAAPALLAPDTPQAPSEPSFELDL